MKEFALKSKLDGSVFKLVRGVESLEKYGCFGCCFEDGSRVTCGIEDYEPDDDDKYPCVKEDIIFEEI